MNKQARRIVSIRVFLAAIALFALTACNVKPVGIADWELYRGVSPPDASSEWEAYLPRTEVYDSTDEDGQEFWLRTTLPASIGEDPALYLYDVRDVLEIYLDGKHFLRVGTMESREANEEARYRILSAWPIIRLPEDAVGKTLLIHCVEPFNDREGINGAVYTGDHSKLQKRFLASDLDMMILGGLFFVVGLAALVIAVFRRDNGRILAFAIFSFAASCQAIAYSEVIYYLIPDVITVMRSFSISTLVGGLMLFVDRALGHGPFYLNRIIWIFFFSYAFYLTMAGEIAGQWLSIASIPLVLFMLGYISYKALRGDLEARLILAGLACFALAGLNDSLIATRTLPNSIFLTQWGVFLLVATMGVALMLRFLANENKLREHARELEIFNKAYERFVPAEFLDQLGKESIVAVELGDQVEKNMTVLFSDIRSFTTLSEKLSPAETFAFINEFLERMGPVIRRHGGFIDKYIGDAIMALFPASPDEALHAAREMLAELESLNADRARADLPVIQIGIGIHIGNLMLGTIGEAERMEGTVISDSVNLASRLEGLTKKSDHNVIVSEAVRDALQTPDTFSLQPLGEAKVKGKAQTVKVYGLSLQ